MAPLTKEDVRHIAKLARLRLTDSEAEKFTTELTSILTFVDMLKEVKTDGVDVTANPTGIVNAFREDTVNPSAVDPLALLGTSGLPIVDRQIMTPSAHD